MHVVYMNILYKHELTVHKSYTTPPHPPTHPSIHQSRRHHRRYRLRHRRCSFDSDKDKEGNKVAVCLFTVFVSRRRRFVCVARATNDAARNITSVIGGSCTSLCCHGISRQGTRTSHQHTHAVSSGSTTVGVAIVMAVAAIAHCVAAFVRVSDADALLKDCNTARRFVAAIVASTQPIGLAGLLTYDTHKLFVPLCTNTRTAHTARATSR